MRSTNGPGYVYFAGHVNVGPIKIGISADPTARLKALQTGSPLTLAILGLMKTGSMLTLEEQMHERFARERLHGEWFKRTRSLKALIDSLPDEPVAAVPKQRGPRTHRVKPAASQASLSRLGELVTLGEAWQVSGAPSVYALASMVKRMSVEPRGRRMGQGRALEYTLGDLVSLYRQVPPRETW